MDYKEIKMTSDGTPWRPLVHALDICRQSSAHSSSRDIVHNKSSMWRYHNNYQVKQIAELLKSSRMQLSFNGFR